MLIDGENFKGKIKAVFKAKAKATPDWHTYDFKSLLTRVLQGLDVTEIIFYFARLTENRDTLEKSRQLIKEQRLLKTHLERLGFTVVPTGRVRAQTEEYRGKKVTVFKEKGVDVRIAVDMVSGACDHSVSHIVLGSSDSDLQPAIQELTQRKVSCTYLGFEMQPNKGLTYTTDRTILIRNAEVLACERVLSLFDEAA